MSELKITADLLRKYDRPGPRYTSYPTAIEFHSEFGPSEYIRRLEQADADPSAPLSIYVHLPFCEERCSFCGCNVIISRKRETSQEYLDYVAREVELIARLLPHRRKVAQLHYGGGTPTYQTSQELARLTQAITRQFEILPDAEVAIEVDPRVTSLDQLETLKALGFNRVSMGVQDFTAEVQEIVNRNQTEEETERIFRQCRDLEFHSINVDLIYGLPLQTPDSFTDTLDRVIALRPDRVACYSFAHVPWIRANQKLLDPKNLPAPEIKVELFVQAILKFTAAGYRKIGMDHFAVPEDEMAQALDNRVLHRNFMGYTVKPANDMIGIGVSSIADVQGAFAQNTKKLTRYYGAIGEGIPPVERGYELSRDDAIRQATIIQLMCNFFLDLGDIARRFEINAEDYFSQELDELREFEQNGFLTRTNAIIEITPLGQLFIRNIAMVFDVYLRNRKADKPVFSRTV